MAAQAVSACGHIAQDEAVALAASRQASVQGGGAWDGPVAFVSCWCDLVSVSRTIVSGVGITGQRRHQSEF